MAYNLALAEAAKVFPPRCRLTLNESTPVNWWKGDAYRSGERYFNLAKGMLDGGATAEIRLLGESNGGRAECR